VNNPRGWYELSAVNGDDVAYSQFARLWRKAWQSGGRRRLKAINTSSQKRDKNRCLPRLRDMESGN
jgi:hypothetical protein